MHPENRTESRSEVITIVDDIYYPSMLSLKDDGIVFDVGDVPYDVPMDWRTADFQVTEEEVGNHAPQERARYRLYDAKGNEFAFIDLEHSYGESIDWMNAFLDARQGEPEPESEAFEPEPEPEPAEECGSEPKPAEEHKSEPEPEPWVPEDFDSEPEEDYMEYYDPEPEDPDYEDPNYEEFDYELEGFYDPPRRASREPYRRRESTTFRRRTRLNHRGLDYRELRREREAWEEEVLGPGLREERRRRETARRRR